MNAIEFLIKEHNKARKMLADISDDSHQFETKRKMFDELAHELLRHETMEHQVWYPRFKDKLSDTVKHLVKEENSAEKAIKRLEALKTEEAWEEHFIQFKQDVEHHAQEEENELFPEVEKILSESMLKQIGQDMREFKQDYPSQ